MSVQIIPVSEEFVDDFRAAVDVVARERKHLAMVEAPHIDMVRTFVCGNIKRNVPQYLAIENNKVVGWCDIIPNNRIGFQHTGVLGMGVLPEYRRQGIGTQLLKATLKAARIYGLERVELEVWASNHAAIMLYKCHNFVEEGRRHRARKLDDKYDDQILMALLLNTNEEFNKSLQETPLRVASWLIVI